MRKRSNCIHIERKAKKYQTGESYMNNNKPDITVKQASPILHVYLFYSVTDKAKCFTFI